jgi:hypothetical protein
LFVGKNGLSWCCWGIDGGSIAANCSNYSRGISTLRAISGVGGVGACCIGAWPVAPKNGGTGNYGAASGGTL